MSAVETYTKEQIEEDLLYAALDRARRMRLAADKLGYDTAEWSLVRRSYDLAMKSAHLHLLALRKTGYQVSSLIEQMMHYEGV